MPNIQEELRAIRRRLDQMDQEISKCRLLDGVSAKATYERLLDKVGETEKQVSEWHAEASKLTMPEDVKVLVRDAIVAERGKMAEQEERLDRLVSSVVRLWLKHHETMDVLIPASKAADLFKRNGWKTRRAVQVLAQLSGRITQLERRGFWRTLWRWIRGRR